MKEVVVVEPGKVEIREVPVPEISSEDEVLIQMKAAGVCGSDHHIYHGSNPCSTYPRIPGHENAGIVVKTGKNVTNVKEGDHVIVDLLSSCGECYQCRAGRKNVCEHVRVRGSGADGGWREYFTAPALSLYGVIRASGDIRLRGKKVTLRSPKESIRNGIALVPEERGIQGLILSESIRYNISLPVLKKISNPFQVSPKKEHAVVDQYMEALQIKAESREMAASNLSGGNQQKVVMAKILAMEPEIFLMYDITRGVDVGTKKEMFTMVRDFAREGRPVVFFSTDVEELVKVCDRVIVMYDGKAGADLRGDALTKENIVGASIGNPVEVKTYGEEGEQE